MSSGFYKLIRKFSQQPQQQQQHQQKFSHSAKSHNPSAHSEKSHRKSNDSTVDLFLRDITELGKSEYMNRIVILQVIPKYYEIADTLQKTMEKEDIEAFHMFTDKLSQFIDSFENPQDFVQVWSFLARLLPKNAKNTDRLAEKLLQYKHLNKIQEQHLPFIVKYFNHEASQFQSKHTKLLLDTIQNHILKDMSTRNPKQNLPYLEVLNRILSGNSMTKTGSDNAAMSGLVMPYLPQYSKELDNYTNREWALLYDFFKTNQDPEGQKITEKLEAKLISKLEGLEDEQLMLFIYNFSQRSVQPPEYWSQLEEEVLTRIDNFTPYELIVIINAFGANYKGSLDLFMEVDRAVGIKSDHVNWQLVPELVFNYALNQKYRDKFFQLMEYIITPHLNQYNAQELAQVMWAYSATAQFNEEFFIKVENALLRKIKDFTANDVDNVWQGLLIGDVHSNLFGSSKDRIIEILKENSADASNSMFLTTALEGFLEHHEELRELGVPLKDALTKRLDTVGKDKNDDKTLIFGVGRLVAKNVDGFVTHKDFLVRLLKGIETYKNDNNNFVESSSSSSSSEDKMEIEYFTVRINSVL
jgi:hypothetical protein